MAIMTAMHPTDEAAAALAHRFGRAVAEHWDRDRCELEARSFVAEIQVRGWRCDPPAAGPDWRRPDAERDPENARQRVAELREIAANAARYREQMAAGGSTEEAL